MDSRPAAAGGVLLPLLATTLAMACFQAGAAVAKGLFPAVGPQGAAALRLAFGALFLVAIGRPWRRWPDPAPLGPILGLGLAVAGSVLCFFQALSHLPLGVALPLQFIGPLGVAVATSRKPSDFLWTALAAVGVWSLVGAGQAAAHIDLRGVPWALGAAVGWAAYILCGRAAGTAWGQAAAPLSLGVAAVIVLPVGFVHAGAALVDPALLPLALGVGLLSGALPFALELYAMPRLPARTFATYTSLEPAFSVLVGLIMLHERLAPIQLAGVAAVISAAAGATWSSTAKAAATPGA